MDIEPGKPPARRNEQQRYGADPWSLQIATVDGIPIRLHFTFVILLAMAGLGYLGKDLTLPLVLIIFTSVVLHELGHSVVAKGYGIPVASITLYPIGGIAMITKRPKPLQEFFIAIAGPAVNVVLAIATVLVLVYGLHEQSIIAPKDTTGALVSLAYRVNLALFLFNLIPAFPMDGGRVLRSALAVAGMPVASATRIATSIGQVLAIVLGIMGVTSGNWQWVFIAIFVYFAAGQEAYYATHHNVLSGLPVSRVMITSVESLLPGNTLREAADRLLSTSQQDFPIVHGDLVVGLLTRDRLLRGLANEGPGAYVAGVMERDYSKATPDDDLENVLEGENGAPILPVVVLGESERLAGLVTAENLSEYFTIQRLLSRGESTV